MGCNSLDDSPDGIERFLRRNPTTCLVAIANTPDGSGIAGVILCGHDGRRAYIYHTAVRSALQGLGIGRLLVEHVLSVLEKKGIAKAALVVFSRNEGGNAFWEKLGFTVRNDLVYRNRTVLEMTRIDT